MNAAIGFIALFALLLFGMPLAFALGIVGFVGFALMVGPLPAGAMSAQIAWDTLASYSLSVLPLFVLMGNLVNHAGLSKQLYAASNAMVGHFKGGLAMATIVACGGFASVSGSSLATAATMSSIAMPSMRKYGYSPALSSGSVAAGGTLGILIPPSVIMVIYGSMTETSIGALFVAGIVPGLIGILFYAAAVRFTVWRDPDAGPAGPKLPIRERLLAIREVWAVLGLFILIIGGIYLGVFTPTEAAGMGASGAFIIALVKRTLTPAAFARVLLETVRTSAMLMCVLVGALIFSNFVNVAGVPSQVVALINWFGLPPIGVILLLILFYLILGCVFDSLAMILLTVPIFFPLVTGLGFDPIWWGIINIMVIEIGQTTPPIGIIPFVLHGMRPDISLKTIFTGIIPFFFADLTRLGIIAVFPVLALWLPDKLGMLLG